MDCLTSGPPDADVGHIVLVLFTGLSASLSASIAALVALPAAVINAYVMLCSDAVVVLLFLTLLVGVCPFSITLSVLC